MADPWSMENVRGEPPSRALAAEKVAHEGSHRQKSRKREQKTGHNAAIELVLTIGIACSIATTSSAPAWAQFIGSIGGLRMVTYDPQSLYAKKSAQSGTSSSGSSTSSGGGSTSAETDLVLTDETITAIGVSGNTKSTLSHKGFTTDGSIILGPSTLSTSAFALADPTADPTVDPVVINYSAYTSIILQREARSVNPSFINSFSNSLR
jgi:hypothetical protein